MIKKMLAGAALAASIVAAGAAAAPQAMAIGDDAGTTTVNGNGSKQIYGNTKTGGYMSPQIGLIQGSLNKPCLALPTKTNYAGGLAGAVPLTNLEDVNIASSPQNQQCTENSTQAKGDDALSHLLDNIPVLSDNGVGNS